MCKARTYFLLHDSSAVDRAVELYLDGHSIWVVGEKIGYSGQSINRALKRRGVERRHGIKAVGSIFVCAGRTYIKTGEGWKLRSRVVAEAVYGKRAIKGKHVHHKDDDSLNDHPKNLLPVTARRHRGITNRSPKMLIASRRGAHARRMKRHANVPQPC